MVITLNSFVGRQFTFTFLSSSGVLSFFFFLSFILFLHLNIFLCHLVLPNFILMFLAGWLYFPVLEKWSYVGDVLWCPEVYSPLVTSSDGCPLCGLHVLSVVS